MTAKPANGANIFYFLSYSISNNSMKPEKVGSVENSNARTVRIVHISDTHMLHESFLPMIPDGDILVHSGDFTSITFKEYVKSEEKYIRTLQVLDDFFDRLPHKHKIFVSGNHEQAVSKNSRERTQNLLRHVRYLQDESVTLEGIKFYGSPWNLSRVLTHARGFSSSSSQLKRHWGRIPGDTDVLVTHQPPQNVLDLGTDKWIQTVFKWSSVCNICGQSHEGRSHWGCRHLKERVMEVR